MLLRYADRGECADRLIALALESGARDNISAIVCDVVVREDPRDARGRSRSSRGDVNG